MDRKPEYRERYAQARKNQADAFAAKVIETAQSCDGSQESFNRSRLLIDSYKWAAARLNPAKYSEKAQVAVTGADGGAVTVIAATAASLQEVKAVRDMLSGAIDIQAEEPAAPALLETSTEAGEPTAEVIP